MIADATPMAAEKREGMGRGICRCTSTWHGLYITLFIGGHRRGIGVNRRFQRLSWVKQGKKTTLS